FLTLGTDTFTNQNGFNHFDAFTVANSLQSGDVIDGGTKGHNDLTALFRSSQDIDSHLSIKNVEKIVFVIADNATITLDASGIVAAPDGTTLVLTGSGTITINHAKNLTIDATNFSGRQIINLDPDSNVTLVGGGGTGSALINASQTTGGKAIVGTSGNDQLTGGSGADTFVGLGGAVDNFVGTSDNDVFTFGAGSHMNASTTIDAGAPALLANGTLGHS